MSNCPGLYINIGKEARGSYAIISPSSNFFVVFC